MEQPAAEEADDADGKGRFAAFRHVSYRRYWLARFCSTFSMQIVSVAVGWQIYDLTRDPLDLGIVGLMQFLPALILVLVTGQVADRYGRRMIMGLAAALASLCAFSLFVLTVKGLHSAVPVFGILFLFGISRAFYGPASAALLANIVPERDFANAVAWNSSSWQFATIGGPVAGGLLYGISPLAAYGTAAFLIGASATLCFFIPKPAQHTEARKISLGTLFEGFRYIRREKVVLGAISLDLFAVLLGGAVALLPVYARDILELGPWGLGLLRSAPGVGALLTALWLSGSSFRDHAGIIMLVFVGLFGLCTVAFGLSTLPWLSILALAGIGATDMVSVYIRDVLLQLWTPDRLRGRVNAVNMVFLGASNELGEFRAGVMAALIGTVGAVVFGGFGAIAVAGLWAWVFPELRRVRRLDGRA